MAKMFWSPFFSVFGQFQLRLKTLDKVTSFLFSPLIWLLPLYQTSNPHIFFLCSLRNDLTSANWICLAFLWGISAEVRVLCNLVFSQETFPYGCFLGYGSSLFIEGGLHSANYGNWILMKYVKENMEDVNNFFPGSWIKFDDALLSA